MGNSYFPICELFCYINFSNKAIFNGFGGKGAQKPPRTFRTQLQVLQLVKMQIMEKAENKSKLYVNDEVN
jgi:hypothetical protein